MSVCAFQTLDLELAEPAFKNHLLTEMECPEFPKKIILCGSDGMLTQVFSSIHPTGAHWLCRAGLQQGKLH